MLRVCLYTRTSILKNPFQTRAAATGNCVCLICVCMFFFYCVSDISVWGWVSIKLNALAEKYVNFIRAVFVLGRKIAGVTLVGDPLMAAAHLITHVIRSFSMCSCTCSIVSRVNTLLRWK